MKMCKRLFAYLLLLTIIANFLVMQAFAHRSVLYVDYDRCAGDADRDGLDETWYVLQTSDICAHISDEVKTIKNAPGAANISIRTASAMYGRPRDGINATVNAGSL